MEVHRGMGKQDEIVNQYRSVVFKGLFKGVPVLYKGAEDWKKVNRMNPPWVNKLKIAVKWAIIVLSVQSLKKG